SSLRPLIFVICVVYALITIGTVALSFTLNLRVTSHGGAYQCEKIVSGGSTHVQCGKIGASTTIQALIWIESILLLPVIIVSMLSLYAPAMVERLPGNTACAIPCSLCFIFVLQFVFLIVCFAKGYMRHHWHMDLALFVQLLFALPVAYLFFNLLQINGESEPPMRDERYNLLNDPNAKNRKNVDTDSNSGSLSRPAAAKAPAPTSGTYEQPVSGTITGTGSREQMSDETGSKEPVGSAEPIPAAPAAAETASIPS
ncbi:hypothetical protein PFISCL1PPCAC_22834, partial [Pristionchus fissidentatus]